MINELTLIVFIISFLVSHILLLTILQGSAFSPSRRKLWYLLMENWTDIRINEGSTVATIQTLRNLLMANSVFISSQLVLLGIFIGIYPTRFGEGIMFKTVFDNLSVAIVQLTIITLCVVFSVFSFILSSRTATSLSFMLTSDLTIEVYNQSSKNLVKKTFLSTQKFWLLGIRGLYFLVSVVTWLIHPMLCIIVTLSITVYLTLFMDLFG